MEENTRDIIRKLANSGDEIYAKICEVTSVNQKKSTVDLLPVDGTAELHDVYLQVSGEAGGVLYEPVLGSLVCVVFITVEMGVVVNYSSLKKYQLKIDHTEILVDSKGILMQRGNDNMGKLLTALIGAIKRMVFVTPAGNTTSMINIGEFEALEPRIKNLLKTR